jgi:RNA polymerase sigma-70 factor (sigma-E family)
MTCQLAILAPTAAPEDASERARRSAAEAAFTDLVAANHDRLARLAYLLCRDRSQAEDAVAEAYAKVWMKFRRGLLDNPASYLRTAVVNQVRGGFRRRLLEVREERRHTVDLRDGTIPELNVDDRGMLEPALRSLPATYRAVVVLRFYEDMSEQAIADVLGVRTGTVKSRCSRALDMLRSQLSTAPD